MLVAADTLPSPSLWTRSDACQGGSPGAGDLLLSQWKARTSRNLLNIYTVSLVRCYAKLPENCTCPEQTALPGRRGMRSGCNRALHAAGWEPMVLAQVTSSAPLRSSLPVVPPRFCRFNSFRDAVGEPHRNRFWVNCYCTLVLVGCYRLARAVLQTAKLKQKGAPLCGSRCPSNHRWRKQQLKYRGWRKLGGSWKGREWKSLKASREAKRDNGIGVRGAKRMNMQVEKRLS